MQLKDVKRVVVVGAGDMGHGIAEACAIAGYEVAMRDIKQEFLDKAVSRIKESVEILARKRKVKEDVAVVMGRIKTYIEIKDAAKDAQLVIEAVPEIMDLKKSVFKELDAGLPKGAIIATNTSNMSITTLASACARPTLVAGLHFFNPAILMKTVEIIPGKQTVKGTVVLLADFVKSLGKIPIIALKDAPGFVINRVQAPSQILLTKAVEKGLIKPNQMDAVARKMGMPMGPFETFDYVGLDVVYHGMNYFAQVLSKDYTPPEWLKKLFDAKLLGKKTNKGIFDWPDGNRPTINIEDATDKISMLDLLCVQVNEGTKLLEEGVVDSPDTIDLAIKNGTGNTMGVMSLLKSVGKDKVIATCERFAKELGVKTFEPTKTLLNWK